MSDERPGEAEPSAREEGGGGEQPAEGAPAPATWAGRERTPQRPGGKEPEPAETPEQPAPTEEPEPAETPEQPAPAEEPEPASPGFEEPEPAAPGFEEPPASDPEQPRPEPEEPEPAAPGFEEPEPAASVPAAGTGEGVAEADTLSPADREEATEAALAGLRARAAEGASKRESKTQMRAAPPPPATAAGARREATPTKPSRPAAAPKPAAEPGEPPKRRGLWPRFAAASLVIVVSIATATAVSLLVYLTEIARGLGGLEGVQEQLTPADGGAPQTILMLGSDARPGEESSRSDTTILLRVDPDEPAIALLSIPRDLRVNIPGRGVDKFNAAYTYGGPTLTLRVVKQLTGLDVHHVVNIDFTGFAEVVNSIGCVYVDVDRHYFIPVEAEVSEINIEAGYQRLCGLKALQYVRYRHTDSDLVRAARQQDFLREARQKLPPSELLSNRGEYLDIFKTYTESDIKDGIQLLELLKTFAGVQSAPVREVHFPAQLGGPNAIYVTASEEAIQKAVDEFLGVEGTPGPQPGGDGAPPGDDRGGDGDAEPPAEQPEPSAPAEPALIDAAATGEQYADLVADDDLRLPPILYPTALVAGSTFSDDSRSFKIDGPSDDLYFGYKIGVALPPGATPANGYFTAYYGMSGTDWRDAPILENPSETRVIDGREYLLFYDNDRLRLVGWKTADGAYWVINTLTQVLSEEQMLAIAQSARERSK